MSVKEMGRYSVLLAVARRKVSESLELFNRLCYIVHRSVEMDAVLYYWLWQACKKVSEGVGIDYVK
jgi:hypothetical protein